MENVAMVGGMEVTHGLSNMDSHSSKPIWLYPLLNAQPANSRDQHWAPNLKTNWPMVAGWLYRKGQWFVLTGISSYYDMDWPSPAFNASAKIPIHEFIEYLIYCHGIPQSSIRFPYVPRLFLGSVFCSTGPFIYPYADNTLSLSL